MLCHSYALTHCDYYLKSTIQLPVDLRMHDADIVSTGNLTGGLLMDVLPEASTVDWPCKLS
ncbi:hypothetical protein [Moritella sp. Urea-trap-13]|uniref:hypothetical protein n=1 Tax=Moritella sp. Urea-trap-13 TaxID=2058327 RepID=UPI000C33E618|nr:hypothetical protein [Moritella sp. Urea-trap-13]PKH06027.1 hypothetical protein CXF93_08800 [Moritella sp. Urea-trap-13]